METKVLLAVRRRDALRSPSPPSRAESQAARDVAKAARPAKSLVVKAALVEGEGDPIAAVWQRACAIHRSDRARPGAQHAPTWPQGTEAAKAAFLEKDGAVPGQVMSYRILLIMAALYRKWATIRLASTSCACATPHPRCVSSALQLLRLQSGAHPL